MKQIVFLQYLSRSGSTYLSNLLDQYADIGVTPEIKIPVQFFRKEPFIKTTPELQNAINSLYTDKKFQGWQIDRLQLKTRLNHSYLPLGLNKFLSVMLDLYFQENGEPINIIKGVRYIRNIKHFRKIFPGCKFIYILRDIRAVYESQKRSLGSTTGLPMANNPVERAFIFYLTALKLDKYKKDPDFYIIKYENLIENSQIELLKLIQFLGASNTKRKKKLSYLQKIPRNQKHLHPNIMDGPIINKIDVWKTSLNQKEIMTFQIMAKNTLSRFEYDCQIYNSPSIIDKYYWIWFLIRYLFFDIPKLAANRKLLINS